MIKKKYFQDYMPGNVCFGCGTEHPEGLQIKSYWDGSVAICHWQPEENIEAGPGYLMEGLWRLSLIAIVLAQPWHMLISKKIEILILLPIPLCYWWIKNQVYKTNVN